MDSKIIEIETKVIKVEVPDYKRAVDELMTAINMHDDEVKRINKKAEITGKSMVDQIATYLIELFEPFMDDDGKFKMELLNSYHVYTSKGSSGWSVRLTHLDGYENTKVIMHFNGKNFHAFELFNKDGANSVIGAKFYSSLAKAWNMDKWSINEDIKEHFKLYELNKHQFFELENEYEKDIDNFKI